MADKVQNNVADFAEVDDQGVFEAFGEEESTKQTQTTANRASGVHVVSSRPKEEKTNDVIIHAPANSIKETFNKNGDKYWQFSVAFGKDADGKTLWGRASVKEEIPEDKRNGNRKTISFNQNEKLNEQTGKYELEKTVYAYMPADMRISIRRPCVDEKGNKINIINKDGKEQWFTPENWSAAELSEKLKIDRGEFKHDKAEKTAPKKETKAKATKAKATAKTGPEI